VLYTLIAILALLIAKAQPFTLKKSLKPTIIMIYKDKKRYYME
jgi:hypothetical protein